ncbi:hypothetical protein [Streptomyces sp. NPDC018031]|uniref:hypothetical protein n=1 Tax=Streptomyces sp. NPDC018031 TaxID=3365033 RepID=UPI00379A62D9
MSRTVGQLAARSRRASASLPSTDSGPLLALGRLALTALAGRAEDVAAKGLTVREGRIDDFA